VHQPAGRVEDAGAHRLHVELDSATVTMLTVVESSSGPPPARVRALTLRQAYWWLVGAQGRAE
jgi:hypothetical protein